ncbi:MAG: hypothetical protein AAF821_01625 [Cyanobacteria bacterium P01_D01_bin.156]
MSSIQTSQLISLLINNVLMVITVALVALGAWLRWRWLHTSPVPEFREGRAKRRRCRWAYISFLLTLVTLLGMLISLCALSLRAIVGFNMLVVGAMFFFLVGVLALVAAMGLCFWDMCFAIAPSRRDRPQAPAVLLSGASVVGFSPRRRRGSRRSRR